MAAAAAIQSLAPVQFDGATLRRLGLQAPRYASYPTADRFSEQFGIGDYLQAVSNVRAMGARNPLSLYVHIPFCDAQCHYCACNRIITKNRRKGELYLSYLKREIAMQARLFEGTAQQVRQLHLGGGTPTWLGDEQLGDLLAHLRRCFRFASDDASEFSIEIDPRTVTPRRIHTLRGLGFNRLSIGVQDFDPDVQQTIHRIQPESCTLDAVAAAREAGFRSVSFDLIYGLPRQNVMSMARTMAKAIAAGPDRIALYGYAHLPQLFRSQRRIDPAQLPDAEARLDMLSLCIRRLSDTGYVYIGMDHFAKPTDELAVAQSQGRLHRNFQGYSTHPEAEVVACGVSAISAVGATYSQNEKTLEAYYERIERGELPIARGAKLSMDDVLRRVIIQLLMCQFELSIRSFETAHPIDFANYFAGELEQLRAFEADGLLRIDPEWITVTPKGRLLIRQICMVFDRYLDHPQPVRKTRAHYSKTI